MLSVYMNKGYSDMGRNYLVWISNIGLFFFNICKIMYNVYFIKFLK